MRRPCSILVLALLCLPGRAPAQDEPLAPSRRVVFSQRSDYGRVLVVDEGRLRHLRYDFVDGDDQSIIRLDDPDCVPMDYVRHAALGVAICPKLRRVLMIGLGGGTYTTMLHRHMPGLEIDAVEINPVVVQAARAHFGLPDDPRYRIHVADGRIFLRRARACWDLVFVDAYTGADDIPPQLADAGFFRLLAAHVCKGGVAMLNLSVEASLEDRVLRSFSRRFAHTACLRTDDDQNLLAFGRGDGPLPSRQSLAEHAQRIQRSLRLPFDLSASVQRFGGCAP